MIVSEIKLFELLKAIIGEKEAEAFVEILETRVDKKFEDAKATLATKEDLAHLETKISDSKVEILRWTFGFFIALILAIIGLYFKH